MTVLRAVEPGAGKARANIQRGIQDLSRIENLNCTGVGWDASSARDKNPAIEQERRRMTKACRGEIARVRPLPGTRVVSLRTARSGSLPSAQNPPVMRTLPSASSDAVSMSRNVRGLSVSRHFPLMGSKSLAKLSVPPTVPAIRTHPLRNSVALPTCSWEPAQRCRAAPSTAVGSNISAVDTSFEEIGVVRSDDHEHPAILQQRRSMASPWGDETAGSAPRVRCGIVQRGRCGESAVRSARDSTLPDRRSVAVWSNR
jgi:hypothetical protein